MTIKNRFRRNQYGMATRRRLLRNVFKTPPWLKRAYKNPERFIQEDFLKRDFLKDSFVYACAGVDGMPIKYWSGLAHSFIYFDAWYGNGSKNTYNVYDAKILELKGYECFFSAEVPLLTLEDIKEIWKKMEFQIRLRNAEAPSIEQENELNEEVEFFLSNEVYWMFNWRDKSSIPQNFHTFAYVNLYKKLPGFNSLHGPDLLALTFVSGEATTSYYHLFSKNCVAPRVICTSGAGFGDHIGIANTDGIFAEVMRMNKGGMPMMAIENNCEEYSKVLYSGETLGRKWLPPLKAHCEYNLPKKIEKILSIDVESDLICAAEEGDLYECKTIIDQGGCDVNLRDNMGFTPLMIASAKGNYEICKILLEKGADVNLKNSAGEDALFLAASSKRAFDVCKLLINSGADVNSKNKKGEKPIHATQTLKERHRTYELLCLLNYGSSLFKNLNEGKYGRERNKKDIFE